MTKEYKLLLKLSKINEEFLDRLNRKPSREELSSVTKIPVDKINYLISNLERIEIENADKPIINIINALNLIDGITTFASCCGHGKKDEFFINFISEEVKPIKKLNKIIFTLLKRDGEFDRLKISIFPTDGDAPIFTLSSPTLTGRKLYSLINRLAKCIRNENN